MAHGYDLRFWIYVCTAAAIVIAATAISARRAAPDQRREAFIDLGMVGVVWLIAGAALTAGTPHGMIHTSFPPVAVAAGGILGVAAAGSLAVHFRGAVHGRGEEPTWLRPTGWILVGLSAPLSALLIVTGSSDPCSEGLDGGAPFVFVLVDFLVAGVAIMCGFVSFLARRWFSALAMLTLPSVGAYYAMLANFCFS